MITLTGLEDAFDKWLTERAYDDYKPPSWAYKPDYIDNAFDKVNERIRARLDELSNKMD